MSTAALKSQTSRDEADIRAVVESIDKAHHNKNDTLRPAFDLKA